MKASHWSHKARLRPVMAPSGVQFAQVGRSVLKLCQNQNNGFTSAPLHMEHHWHSDFIWWGNTNVNQIMKSSKRETKVRQEESNLCLKSLMVLSEWCSRGFFTIFCNHFLKQEQGKEAWERNLSERKSPFIWLQKTLNYFLTNYELWQLAADLKIGSCPSPIFWHPAILKQLSRRIWAV